LGWRIRRKITARSERESVSRGAAGILGDKARGRRQMQVKFSGFKFGNVTKELMNGEFVGPTLRGLGIDTQGVAVLVNGTRIEESDLNRFGLRDGDEVKATVKAIGGR